MDKRSRIAQGNTHYNLVHSNDMHVSDAWQEKGNENVTHCAICHILRLQDVCHLICVYVSYNHSHNARLNSCDTSKRCLSLDQAF